MQPNTLLFLLKKKIVRIFSHSTNKKYKCICNINIWNFNKTLTNNLFNFRQAAPDDVKMVLKQLEILRKSVELFVPNKFKLF